MIRSLRNMFRYLRRALLVPKEGMSEAIIRSRQPFDNSCRTCARLCHASGGELEQIQFLLGHLSVQTTKRYLDCKQRIQSAVNDRIGVEPQL